VRYAASKAAATPSLVFSVCGRATPIRSPIESLRVDTLFWVMTELRGSSGDSIRNSPGLRSVSKRKLSILSPAFPLLNPRKRRSAMPGGTEGLGLCGVRTRSSACRADYRRSGEHQPERASIEDMMPASYTDRCSCLSASDEEQETYSLSEKYFGN
jgi:hypothetical protein